MVRSVDVLLSKLKGDEGELVTKRGLENHYKLNYARERQKTDEIKRE